MPPTPRKPSIQEFVQNQIHIVGPIAGEMRRKLPEAFELEDLIGAGNLGLASAALSFEPRPGPSADGGAKAWAQSCIRRAIQSAVQADYPYQQGRLPLEVSTATDPDGIPVMAIDVKASDEYQRLQHHLEESGKSGKLSAAIAELTPRERELIDLVYEQNRSINEVAKEGLIGLKRRAVRNEHKKALGKIEAALRPEAA